MAHVSRNRGQLILVTGLLVAVAMVALVLLLNTAIYTENLASRGADQSGREAIEYRAAVTDGVRELIEQENDREYRDHAEVGNNVHSGIVAMDNLTARSYAVGGTITQINETATTVYNGTAIHQPEERPLENRTNEPDWVLVTAVEEARSFSMVVQSDQLRPTNASRVDQDGAFNVTLEDSGGNQWKLYVYENDTSGDEVAVAVYSDGTTEEVWSAASAAEVRIDLAERTIDGTTESDLDWTDDLTDPYDISYNNGNNATGTYNLTVKSDDVVAGNFFESADSPNYVAIVYSVDLSLGYRTDTLTYRTEVTIAPGEQT